jgi:APA family basic amino acid/polyamine antiporter
VLVSAGVLVLRRTDPHRPRPFRSPGVPLVPILSIVCCVGLMIPLPGITWFRFVAWLIIGFVIYFGYGQYRSRLGRTPTQRPPGGPPATELPKASMVNRP